MASAHLPVCSLSIYIHFAKLSNKASHSFFCKPQDKQNSRFYFLCPILAPQAAPLSLQQNSGGSVLTPATLLVTPTLFQKWKNSAEALLLRTFHLKYFDVKIRTHLGKKKNLHPSESVLQFYLLKIVISGFLADAVNIVTPKQQPLKMFPLQCHVQLWALQQQEHMDLLD